MQTTKTPTATTDAVRNRPQSGGHRGQLLLYLTLRELRSKYRRTALGWAWSLINPLVTAVIYAAVFGAFFKIQPPVGNPSGIVNFALFMLAGLLPWNMFSSCLNGGMGSIVGNAGLIQKVSFQRSTLVTSACISAAITLTIEMAVTAVLIAVFERPLVLVYALTVPAIIVLLTIFSTGLGLVLGALNVYFRDLQYLMSLALLGWFYLTPIVYPLSLVPERLEIVGLDLPARDLVRLNPMTKFTTVMREAVYDLRVPTVQSWLQLCLLAGTSLLVGALVFRRLQGRFAEEL
jgi:ABC-2 type transport system permease protein